MGKIKEYLHKRKMRKNTLENTIDTLKEEKGLLMIQLIEVQELYIKQLEKEVNKNARGRRRNTNKAIN